MEFDLIREFLQAKRASSLSVNTVKGYEYHLRQYWQFIQSNGIGIAEEKDIIDYFVFLSKKDYSIVTLKDKYIAIKAYLNFTKRGHLLDKIKKPVPKGQARCFTDKEVNTILASFRGRSSFISVRDYTIICVLLATGIRKAELLQLKDIDGDFFVIKGKGGKIRTVPISPALKRILRNYVKMKNELYPMSIHMFVNQFGEPMRPGGLRAVFTRLQQRTGIKGKRFSPHTFRHYFATRMLKNGADLLTLQKILGHSQITTTAIYLNFDDNFVREQNDKYCPLDNLFI